MDKLAKLANGTELAKDVEGVIDLFLHSKPSGIMLCLKDSDGKYASILSKEVDCTYTHTLKILNQLKDYKLVDFKKDGRIKTVYLTPEGEDVAHELVGLVRKLERVSKNGKEETSEEALPGEDNN